MNKVQEATKAPNIDKLYEKLFSIKEMLTEVIQTAQEAANDAGNFGGDISTVLPNQLRSQFVMGVQNFISQPGNPVAVDSMIQYLDSLPLSKVRVPRGEEAMMQQGMMNAAAGAPAPMPGTSAMTGVQANAGSAIPPAPGAGMAESLQSSILRAKGQPLLDEARRMWEEEHQEEAMVEGALDFRAIKEGYQRRPPTPEVFTRNDEEKIYTRTLESAQKRPSQKLREADMLASPYAREDVSDMSGWRDLVEEHNIDESINERLGAAAVASALLSEQSPESTSAGIKRMKELVSPEPTGMDAGGVAAALAAGRLDEDFQDEIVPTHKFQEAAEGEDLTALVLGDNREPMEVR